MEEVAEETIVADIAAPETTASEDETIPIDQTGGDTLPEVDAAEETAVAEIAAAVSTEEVDEQAPAAPA